jgi:flagellar hook capping protein FlgD
VRVGGGHVYTANVTVTPAPGAGGPTSRFPLGIVIVPDPGAGAVRFECDVDRAGEGVIQIHDVAGRRIAVIARGSFPPGRHRFDWDGRDASGGRAGRGIYFVRMAVNHEEVAQRFTLIR